MINVPNNLPNFLLTQISAPEKPFILKVADYLLAPLRIPTSYEQNVINDEGLLRKNDYRFIDSQIRETILISSALVLIGNPLVKAIFRPVYLSECSILTSKTINVAKKLNTYFIKKIDERGDFFGCKLLKGVALVISAALPVFALSFGLFGIYLTSNLSLPFISLIALGSLSLQLSAGVLLKVIAFNRYPKIKLAYDNYLNKTKNLDFKLPDSKDEVVDNSNKIRQGVIKLQNNESLGFLNFNADVTGLILSSYLPVNDLIQFRTANKTLSQVFSTKTILIHRIQDSFSTDFINKLGLEHILNAMEQDPLDPLLIPNLTVLHNPVLPARAVLERNYVRALSFERHMENKPIAWGHESVQTPKNNSKLFLFFNDIKNTSFICHKNTDKYYMIASHDNSKLAWEQRAIHKIVYGGHHFPNTIPIYKVDEDHYSIHPLSDLDEEDLKDDTQITKTDFFKNFKTPEALIQI